MRNETKIQVLAGAAASLCAALEEMSRLGYNDWSSELRQLIEIIGLEIDWLERETKLPLAQS